jgi:aspartyl-tRNA synthetase
MGGQKVILHGFIKSLRKINQKVFFLDLYDYRSGPECAVQLISSIDAESTDKQKATHNSISKLPPFVPVAVTGTVVDSISPPLPNTNSQVVKEAWAKKSPKHRPEIRIESLVQLNTVSPNLIYTPETAFPPEKRHLQLRTMKQLSKALRMRAKVSALCRQKLRHLGFLEVETPLLFKSTPEGAREFLVPTRNSGNGGGMCYALPQSPQQYKQILMASGVDRYFQFARCFRDEDLRADRQPEFTQLDLEMSFSRGEDVMHIIEGLLKDLWFRVLGLNFFEPFKRMTYNEAMKSYGTDKPDMRFKHLKVFNPWLCVVMLCR